MADESKDEVTHRPGLRFTAGWLAAVGLTFIAAAALVRARDLQVQRQAQQLEQEIALGRRVLVTHVEAAPSARSLAVPASVHGFIETPNRLQCQTERGMHVCVATVQ